jgi:hypothetical protein
MPELEQLLRDSLAKHIDDAPAPTGGAVAYVRARARRRAWRIRAAAAGLAAAVAGVATVAVAPLVREPSVALAPGALVAGPLQVPSFPYAASDSLGIGAPTVTLENGQPVLRLDAPGGGPGLSVSVASGPVTGKPLPCNRGCLVDDRKVIAVIPEGAQGAAVALSWEDRNDRWIVIRAHGELGVSILLKFAVQLKPEPTAVTMPFAFTVLPAGLVASDVSPSGLILRRADASPRAQVDVPLAVLVDERLTDEGRAVTIEGRRGRVVPRADGVTVQVEHPNARVVTVHVPAGLGLTEAEAIRFAAGITMTDAARPGNG